MSANYEAAPFSDLKGEIITKIDGAKPGSDYVTITTDSGVEYMLYHEQDCCECVIVEDVVGDIGDLIGRVITKAEESTSRDRPADKADLKRCDDSETWTFYLLATVRGYVTIRWFGSSNGYYSERVDVTRRKLIPAEPKLGQGVIFGE